MPSAGQLNHRCAFFRRAEADDGYGNVKGAWQALVTVWGGLFIEPGREAIAGGRLENATAGTLTLRWSEAAAGITTADRVEIDGVSWNIRSTDNRDQRRRYVEMRVEKGGAVG